MLGQGVYRNKGLALLGKIPIGLQLRSVHQCPVADEAQRTGWQRAVEYHLLCDADSRPVLAVLRVEVGRRMIRPVHPNDDSVEAADLWHHFPHRLWDRNGTGSTMPRSRMRDLAERCMHRSEDTSHATCLDDAHVRHRLAAHAPPGTTSAFPSHARHRRRRMRLRHPHQDGRIPRCLRNRWNSRSSVSPSGTSLGDASASASASCSRRSTNAWMSGSLETAMPTWRS